MQTPQGPALLWRGYQEPAAWLALVWSALGPGALAAYLQDAGMLTDDDLFIMIPAQPCFCPQCTACWQILKPLCGVMLCSSCRSEPLPLARAQSKVRVWCAVQGQSKVPAPQAQIIFSSLPLWSAFFAAVLMQGDSMGPSGWGRRLVDTCGRPLCLQEVMRRLPHAYACKRGDFFCMSRIEGEL